MIGGHGFGWGVGWGLIGLLLMAAFWTLIVFLIVGLVRSRGGAASGRSSAALHILEERYARGEIDRQEFLDRRAVLTGERSEPGEPAPPA